MLIPLISKTRLLHSAFKNVYFASNYCTKKPVESKPQPDMDISRRLFEPNNFERKMLVWSGRYKSVEDIPQAVPAEQIEKARNKTRIRIANYMIVATLIGCFIMVQTGKRAAERGESITKMNEDWHKKMNVESK